ncbi:hypothetical protein GOP47_0014270 [Adiantum capillus-veneris]|uniref:Protein kinase domain-containing protein n=1 Tax=Adiantum capillus-veneris TaxID=13818 RepID=A0A9D4ULY6_ADICA|nr:hypothetical protein GOP47_0014270 [Adiantum capillus-veneris]
MPCCIFLLLHPLLLGPSDFRRGARTYTHGQQGLRFCSERIERAASDDEERMVLMHVKAALDPEGRVLHSWVMPAGEFEGVAWNAAGKVANISLQGRGLQGFIPSAIAELTALTGLYLHYNKLTGPIPAVLYKLSSLTDLYLNVNLLTGTIPAELGLLYNLQALQLCCNALEGQIPMELGALKQLNVLALQHNSLVGEIPPSLGYLVSLSRLDLSFNRLNGTIPSSLERLSKLTILDVSSNFLSGPIPPTLQRLQQGLSYGNNSMLCGDGFPTVSSCRHGYSTTGGAPVTGAGPEQPIAGSEPEPPASNVSTAAVSADPQHYLGSVRQGAKVGSRTAQVAVVSGVVAFAVGGVLIGLFIFVLFRRHKQRISSAFEVSDHSKLGGAFSSETLKPSSADVLNSTYKVHKPHLETHLASSSGAANASHRGSRSFGSFSGVVFFNGSHQSFQYDLEELEVATNFFSDKNLLGKRAGHSAVYKGVLRDGSSVAIRALHKASCKTGMSEFRSVVGIIAQLRQENIVALKGFCCSSSKADCFLVYDYMTNGTLQEHLDRRLTSSCKGFKASSGSLDWAARARIALNIARGLNFMHKGTDEAVIHQNVSAANVLLDQNCNAFLSDAGRLTEKSDVYALGVLLLQLLTGKVPSCVGNGNGNGNGNGGHELNVGAAEERTAGAAGEAWGANNMVSWARSLVGAGFVEELMDASLKGKYSSVAATHMAAVAFACTQEDSAERPDSSEVVSLLEKMDDASALTAGLSSGEDYPRRQQAIFAERLLDNGR